MFFSIAFVNDFSNAFIFFFHSDKKIIDHLIHLFAASPGWNMEAFHKDFHEIFPEFYSEPWGNLEFYCVCYNIKYIFRIGSYKAKKFLLSLLLPWSRYQFHNFDIDNWCTSFFKIWRRPLLRPFPCLKHLLAISIFAIQTTCQLSTLRMCVQISCLLCLSMSQLLNTTRYPGLL